MLFLNELHLLQLSLTNATTDIQLYQSENEPFTSSDYNNSEATMVPTIKTKIETNELSALKRPFLKPPTKSPDSIQAMPQNLVKSEKTQDQSL